MSVFISHSSRDGDAVSTLVEHLEAANETVWLDKKLSGGQAWWDEILRQIRECAVFVVALSNNSRNSNPCRSELDYAKALGLPILPVQIGETDWYLVDPTFTNILDYRTPNAQSSIKLITSLRAKAAERSDLPDPLPEPPPVPYEYLQRIGATIDAESVSPTEQSRIVMELRSSLANETDPSVVSDIRHVLRNLRRRPDVTFTTASEIDELLAQTEELPPPAPPPSESETASIPPMATVPHLQPPAPPPPSYSPPSQPSMPSWQPPAPPQAPNRGKWIALSVGAIAAASIVGLVIWLVVRPSGGGSSTASKGTSTSSTTRTSTSTPSSSEPPTVVPGGEAELREMLPQGYTESACRSGNPQGPGGVARLDCGQNTMTGGPSGATYLTFSDQSSVDEAFDKVVANSNVEMLTCPGLQEPSPTVWHLRSTPTVDEGKIACGKYKNQDLYTLLWTHDSKLFYGGGDSTDIDALYKWWQQYT